MCEYVTNNKCMVTHDVCPYMYYCDKIRAYKPSQSMPTNCKIKEKASVPKGAYKVRDERKGWLYIDYKGITIKVKNPFDNIPLYVHVQKLKNGEYKLRE